MSKDNKTIAITLRFWTNDLKVLHHDQEKTVCWDSGMAIMEKNHGKGIKYSVLPFACYEDIVPLIKETFRKNKIAVVSDNKRPRVLSHRRKDAKNR